MNKTIFNNAVTVKNMLRSIGLSFFILCANCTLAADPYPTCPIRITDWTLLQGKCRAQLLEQWLQRCSELLKQSVVIENHPGAGGNIASEQTIRSTPDGYTIMLGTIGSSAVNQHLSKLSYDPAVDMQALSMAIVFFKCFGGQRQ
jgi:hypothetical protein